MQTDSLQKLVLMALAGFSMSVSLALDGWADAARQPDFCLDNCIQNGSEPSGALNEQDVVKPGDNARLIDNPDLPAQNGLDGCHGDMSSGADGTIHKPGSMQECIPASQGRNQ